MALIGPAVFEGVYYSEIHVPRFRLEMTFYESELSQVKHQRYEFFMLAVIFFSMTISILKGIYWHILTKYCFGCHAMIGLNIITVLNCVFVLNYILTVFLDIQNNVTLYLQHTGYSGIC